jgi:L-ascorbate metabolism protein UlaG (beta-lactamase superfamily)
MYENDGCDHHPDTPNGGETMSVGFSGVMVILTLFLCMALAHAEGGSREVPEEAKELLRGVTWFMQAAVRIEAEKTIYVDPYRLGSVKKDADIILITHSHGDHLSPPDIARIARQDTVFVCPRDERCLSALKGKNVKVIAPGEKLEVGGVKIAAVPAYNLNKPYHPKSNAWVGYVVQVGERTFYFAGDTDLIPEMKDIQADVAFIPAGGKYTMDATEAAQAATLIKAKYFVPYHCGGATVGQKDDFETFSRACPKAVIMAPEGAR